MIDVSPPDPAPVRRRRWLGGLLAGLVVVAGGVTVAVAASRPAHSARPAQTVQAAPTVESAVLPRPAVSAPGSDWQAWVSQEVTAALNQQTTALLAGDSSAYAAVALPAARAQATRWFRSLRALQVNRFDQHVDGSPWAPEKPAGDWRAVTAAAYCFVDTDCTTDTAVFDSMWRVTPEGIRLSGYRAHNVNDPCIKCPEGTETFTEPWVTTELTAMVGARTLVAVPLAYRSRLADLSRRAESAAAIADRYTVGPGRVDRYRIFVADPGSWKRWYDGYPGAWVAGQSVATGRERIEVEVLASQLTAGFADQLLRHELAHVSTLRNNSFYGRDDVWWLAEGMAEYVELRGGHGDIADERADLHSFLRSHHLRSVKVFPPVASASAADASGRYAVGYFALDHLFTRYEHAAVLQFFEQAVQEGVGLDTASRSAFGQPWSKVDQESTAAVSRA